MLTLALLVSIGTSLATLGFEEPVEDLDGATSPEDLQVSRNIFVQLILSASINRCHPNSCITRPVVGLPAMCCEE